MDLIFSDNNCYFMSYLDLFSVIYNTSKTNDRKLNSIKTNIYHLVDLSLEQMIFISSFITSFFIHNTWNSYYIFGEFYRSIFQFKLILLSQLLDLSKTRCPISA